jgi:hypothetical protein
MATEPDRPTSRSAATERGPALALFPIAATLAYYLLPPALQKETLIQFLPQLVAYGALGLWTAHNAAAPPRLGLTRSAIRKGLQWGLVTGLLLGSLNTYMILKVVPSLGYDVTFLTETPHARLPVFVMVPWFIGAIAVFVEVNFRGFLLGRLALMESGFWSIPLIRRLSPFALIISTLMFAFDPFMVNTFRHLHWIALWDGLVWGAIRLGTGNLWITIVAHAVEVLMMYVAVRAALTIP